MISGSGRCPGEGNGKPLLYTCLENAMDRGAWRATVHGVAKSGHDRATIHTHTHTGHMCPALKDTANQFSKVVVPMRILGAVLKSLD